jgi:hypothetical protein
VQLRPTFPHGDRLAIYDSAVQSSNSWARVNLHHFDESESSRQAGIPVGHQFEIMNGSKRLKK